MERNTPVGKSFVVPIHDGNRELYVSLATLKPVRHASVVYVGREITPRDLFAKIVESGSTILPSVDEQMAIIQEYFDQLSGLRIGDIVKIDYDENAKVVITKQQRPQSSRDTRRIP
jgi:PDZ domain-containing secreted protein